MHSPEHIDYLAIGHICHDLSPSGKVIGGAAAYASTTAQVLGCRTAVVTSSAAEDDWYADLPGTVVHVVPSPQTTVFENVYTPEGRVQTIHAVAGRLTSTDIPAAWQRASIVHLGPIANEVDPEIIHLFSNSLVGVAPQGWMRRWDNQGIVTAGRWAAAEQYLRFAAAVFVSEEDLVDDEMFHRFRDWSRLLVLTQGSEGCTIFFGDEVQQFPSHTAPVVDPTGAGDIFAAAFLVRLFQTGGNPSAAAQFANKAAALSISVSGLPAVREALAAQLVLA
jgi:sugar/nucleoside kinase (ribokinase family)